MDSGFRRKDGDDGVGVTWIPAFAGKTVVMEVGVTWIPAFAGKTVVMEGCIDSGFRRKDGGDGRVGVA